MAHHPRSSRALGVAPTDHATTAPGGPRRYMAVGVMAVLLVIAAGAALQAMASVVIPVVFALFVTLAVAPLDHMLAARLPDRLTWIGRIGVIILLLLIITLFIAALAFCVGRIAAELPNLSGDLGTLVQAPDGDGRLAQMLRQASDLIEGQIDSIMGRAIDTATSLARGILGGTGAIVAGVILVLFLVLLALSETRTWEAKLDRLSAAGPHGTWRDVTTTLGTALRRFIATRALLGVLTAAIYTAWLMPFGVDLLLVWAILTVLMNFIPNIGSIVSGLLPTIYAFFTLDVSTAFLIGAGLIVIEQVIGNWLDPRVQGSQITLSPLVILIAVVFWGWLWGVAGAFLATPMTLAIMILCNASPPLRPVALLLSNQKCPEDLDAALA